MRFQSHILSELDGRDYLKLSLSHLEEKIYIKILENIQTLFKTFDIFLYKITVYGEKKCHISNSKKDPKDNLSAIQLP